MLCVISPAKKLDMTPVDGLPATRPAFPDETETLVRAARRLTLKDLQNLMGISPDLAKLNRDRFRDFDAAPVKQAVLSFAGDTYQGLEAGSLEAEELDYAQDHLRILSGLFGVLRPFDEIQPYRLEMGSRLKTRRGPSLYAFWGDRIAEALNAQAESLRATTLVNCASQEYFGAVDLKALRLDVVTPVFLEDKPGGPKIVSFFAKKARGAMARFIVQNRLTDPEALKDFDLGGYAYQPERSTPEAPVFLRDDQAALAKAS